MGTTWPAAATGTEPGVRLPLRVMIVDDHDVVRGGLRALLEASGELVVAEAADCAGAVREALATKPQVIIMDVRLGEESGITATRQIREVLPDARVLMLTSFVDEEALAASMLVGASGFVLKTIVGDDIVRSVRAVARGESAFDPELLLRGGFDRIAEQLHGSPEVRTDVPPDRGPSSVVGDIDAGHTEDDRNPQGG